MADRCSAVEGKWQCRKTKNLTRARITIHREPSFVAKLPAGAIILLCPDHLRLSPREQLVANSKEVRDV